MREQLKYPHFSLGQTSGFIGLNIPYHQLTFEQFVAGELTTINNTNNTAEFNGRIELLSQISLWNLRANVLWPQVRNVYAHIIRKIENREIDWQHDWSRFERNLYDTVSIKSDKKVKHSAGGNITSSPTTQKTISWFCRNYQKQDGCPKTAPHPGRVGNKFRNLEHICAACWIKEKTRRHHPECSNDCPNKEN